MGKEFMQKPGDAPRQRKMRPRQRNIPSEDLGGPLPMDDDEVEPITPVPAPAPVPGARPAPVPTTAAAAAARPVAPPAAVTAASNVPPGGDLAKELAKVKADKAALETAQQKLEASLKKASEDLNDAQENIAVYEEMMSSFTKKEDTDLQEFVDLVSEWKGKAKVFDQGQKAIEDNKTLQKQVAQMKTDLDAQKQKLVEAEAAAKKVGDSKPTGAVSTSALDSAAKEWKAKYEQAIKDLDSVKSKVAALEKDVKSKESDIAELKGRLQVALATNTGGAASGTADDDPLIEMVEKLMKEMEAMAKENEEYMARLEEEIFSADKADESSSESKDTGSMSPIPAPAHMQPPKPASAAASPKMAPATQQSSSAQKAPPAPMKPGMQPQQKK